MISPGIQIQVQWCLWWWAFIVLVYDALVMTRLLVKKKIEVEKFNAYHTFFLVLAAIVVMAFSPFVHVVVLIKKGYNGKTPPLTAGPNPV